MGVNNSFPNCVRKESAFSTLGSSKYLEALGVVNICSSKGTTEILSLLTPAFNCSENLANSVLVNLAPVKGSWVGGVIKSSLDFSILACCLFSFLVFLEEIKAPVSTSVVVILDLSLPVASHFSVVLVPLE